MSLFGESVFRFSVATTLFLGLNLVLYLSRGQKKQVTRELNHLTIVSALMFSYFDMIFGVVLVVFLFIIIQMTLNWSSRRYYIKYFQDQIISITSLQKEQSEDVKDKDQAIAILAILLALLFGVPPIWYMWQVELLQDLLLNFWIFLLFCTISLVVVSGLAIGFFKLVRNIPRVKMRLAEV